MPFNAPKTSRKGIEAGVYNALGYCVLDIGEQESKFGIQHKMVIGWKLLDKVYDDGNNHTYHQTFTVKMSPKSKLQEMLSGWFMGQDIDWSETCFSTLINRGCQLVLAPNENGTVVVKTAMPYDAGSNSTVGEFFSFSDWEASGAGALPEFLNTERNSWKRNFIENSLTYKTIKGI